MKPKKSAQPIAGRSAILATAIAAGALAIPAHASTFTFGRGVAGSFSWNNSTGVTAGESAPSAVVNGNWGASAGTVGTVAGTNFPGVAGDIANLNNSTNATQTLNLDQNVAIGQLVFGNTSNTNTRTVASGGAGTFVLTMDNAAANSSISQTSTSIGNVTAAIAIGGNGTLALSNSSATGQLNINGGITSALASGTQTVSKTGAQAVTVNGVIGNGLTGGTVAVDATAGTLTLTGANTYTGSTTITAGTLILSGTTAALSANSAITNNGTLTIDRSNSVVQGTDFSSSGISGTGALNVTGTGLALTLNTANTYAGTTTIGAAANNSVVRATATGALGTGGTVQFDGTGNGSTARLELSGGITLSNPTIQFSGRNNTTVGIQSISGSNTLSGNLNLQGGGSTYTVQSDADQLTLSGTIANASGSGTRILTVTGVGNGLVSGAITNGTGNITALTKSGGGTWTLSNASNTYTGATTVSAGTLLINGALGNTAVGVTAGTLGGSGTIAGTVSVSGTGKLSAGNSIESLATGALTMGSGSSFVYEASNNSSTGADLVAVGGTISLTGVNLDLTGSNLASGTWGTNDKITLISYTGTGITSGFTGFTDDTSYTFGANQWLFNYNDTVAGANFAADALSGTSFVTMTVIPEPAAAVLSGFGLLALLCRRRS
ncbi:MAG: autotransporter-associated beta strand repeat-containing protein [Luteolibacter sp.]